MPTRQNALLQQLWKFALVGGVGFVVDTVSFTLLRLTPAFTGSPLKAGVISTVLAIIANWLGNRYWVFGPHRSRRGMREGVEFFAVSLLGMLVALGCLAVSHYLLGFDSILADNIAKNVVGLVLGSAIRFLLYRSWVYHPRRAARANAATAAAATIMPEPVDTMEAAAEASVPTPPPTRPGRATHA